MCRFLTILRTARLNRLPKNCHSAVAAPQGVIDSPTYAMPEKA
jgi:hypothetical protein